MRTIAIGDIHGCSKALETLLEAIEPGPQDLLIPVGDYIDRGPDSRGVLDQLLILETRCRLVPLLGNHEIMFLRAFDVPGDVVYWLQCGGNETLESYGGFVDQVPDEHLEFLRRCWPYCETAEHIFVHANYAPDLPLEQQPDYLLFWEHISHSPPGLHMSGKTAVVGHTPQVSGEILDLGHLICIDTCCFGGGWLTALDVNTGRVWQANQRGALRSGRSLH